MDPRVTLTQAMAYCCVRPWRDFERGCLTALWDPATTCFGDDLKMPLVQAIAWLKQPEPQKHLVTAYLHAPQPSRE